MNTYRKLLSPVKIGNLEIKNRFAMAPMGPVGLADAEGGFTQRGIDYFTERAKGGTGLIITGVTFVDNEIEKHGMPDVPNSTWNPIHFIRTAREMTERIHAYNARVFLQMSGGFGRVTIPTNMGEFPPVAPSPIQHRWLDKTCRELTVSEIKTIVKRFGEGAFHAKRAGFDGVQIHAVHEGYLIDQFAITLFNQRTDEYGGSLENRLRFAREICEEIKKTCGDDYPVTLRYSPKSFIKSLRDGALPGEEFKELGRDLPEGIEAARLLVAYGYDALDVDVGSYDAWWWSHPPMYQEKGLYMPFAKEMKKHVDVPIICAGRMDNPELALRALAEDVCDIISLGRPLLADPDYVNKLKAGKTGDIRPCISCQEGCMGRIQEFSMINCAVNPQAARERINTLRPALSPKKVLVIGGGVAGCEAARVLALRGHQPELFEATDSLGGNLRAGGVPDFKEDDIRLADWYVRQLAQLGVKTHLDTRYSPELADYRAYDTVIVATGTYPRMLSFEDSGNVHAATDVLLGKVAVGDQVTIVGGGLVGCETALWLKEKGKDVNLVELQDELLANNGPLCHANREMLERLIPHAGIVVKTGASAERFSGGKLRLNTKTGPEIIPCDTLVMAIGYTARAELFAEIDANHPETYLLGDARKVANIMYAIWDAFEVASHI